MSANSGTLASTKGESNTSSTKTTKSSYDHLDINKLYKGKSAEPVPKAVTQKHGMQTLGKAPPARRAGATITSLKPESNESNSNSAPIPLPSNTLPPQQQQQQQPVNHQQPPPGWVGPMPHPMGMGPPHGPPHPPPHNHNVPGAPLTGQQHQDKKWIGGMRGGGNFPSQRFAQDFPSLESTGEPAKGQVQNSSGPPPGTVTGLQSLSKASDNQYGPGPILRPQTEGSWTQGGGLGMPRPHGPMQSQNAPSRDFATDRSNLGGPTPPPMSVGQAGPIPPPLGAYPMNFRGMQPPPYPPHMYQGSGPPPGPGGYFPQGQGIRYGMPIPPGAPPPGSYPPGGHPGDGRREDSGRGGRGHPNQNQMRPGSHFMSTSIIRKDEMERMNEIGVQEGGWAATDEAIDYNKKINFGDDDDGKKDKETNRSQNNRNEVREVDAKNEEDRDRKQTKSEKQPSINERNDRDREQQPRYETNRPPRDQYDHENDDDRNNRKPYDNKERDRGGRRPRDDDWRSPTNRYEDDRGNKISTGGGRGDTRGPSQDFQSTKYPTNIPPRFQRQNIPPAFAQPTNQRQTPSPVSTSTSGSGKDRDRDYRERDWERDRDRDRDQQSYRGNTNTNNYRILERRKTDSESSRDSKDIKRNQSNNDHDVRNERFQEKDYGKGSRFGSADNRSKGTEETNKSVSHSNSGNSIDKKEVNDLDNLESRTAPKDTSKKDDAKATFRSRTELSTSSWADEVEDEESSKVNEDIALQNRVKESHQHVQPKRNDEREKREHGPRRVFINQRQVENLVTHIKPETPAEQKVQPQPKKEEKTDEKVKILLVKFWGERTKEKDLQEREELPTTKERPHLPEKGVEKSSSKDSLDKEKPKREDDRPRDYGRHKDFEKHVEPHKPKEFDKHRESDRHGKEFVKHKDNNREMDRRERDRPERERDDYEGRGSGNQQRYRREREREPREKKPASAWNEREKVKQEKEDPIILPPPPKEKTPDEKDKESEKEKAKELKDVEKKDDSDARSDKGQRGPRNRERGGTPVYQARGAGAGAGAWGNSGISGRARGGRGTTGRGSGGSVGSGGSGSQYYDKPTKRLDSDRERDEKENSHELPEAQVAQPEKEKLNKQLSGGSSQESGSKKDLTIGHEDRSTQDSRNKKVSAEKEGELHKKVANSKSPSGSRRNGNARGGSRLQGYGPPSDRNPFSSNNSKQEDEPSTKEKSSDGHHAPKQHTVPPVTSGPVPLMALGEISPPEMPSRSRHHGRDYGHSHQQHGGRAMPPRLRGGGGDPSYSFRGGNNKNRGGGMGGSADAAKPLMSLSSNDLDRGTGEWISESESEAENKKGLAASTQSKKESNIGNKAPGAGSEKYRQNQNLSRSASNTSTGKGSQIQEPTNSSNQDSANNNRGAKPVSGRGDVDQYSLTQGDLPHSNAPQESSEAGDGEVLSTGFHEVRNKKTFVTKDNSRGQKENFEKGGAVVNKTEKSSKASRPVKNPPYDPRPQMAPRFLAAQQRESPPIQQAAVGSGKPTTDNGSVNSFKEAAPVPHGNAWEKPITASLRPETQSSNMENKEADMKLSSHLGGLTGQNLITPIGQGSTSCPPVQTMIFENTNLKSGFPVKYPEPSKTVAPNKISEGPGKKEIGGPSQSQGLEMSKEFPLSFGEDTPQLDFGSSFSDPPTSTIASHSQQVYKSTGLLQSSRSYGSHQSSPISPLAADLNEKIQAVKSMWDLPSMPSVAEQSGNACGSEEDALPSGFNNDAFKRQEPPSRDYGQSLQQQTSIGFAPGTSPAVSVIAKPDSRSSPNSINIRQIKPPQQQNLMDPQNHAAVSSSPFAYGLAQQHPGAANTFGMRAVPSPPSLMYGSSHASTTQNAVYQAFPQHVDSSQVVGSNPRTQYAQYTNAQVGNTGGAPYMGGSLFLPLFDSHYSLPSYHTQHQHQQQPQGIPSVQVQSQNSRISPGPGGMPMTSSAVVGGAVMMNSNPNANSMMTMKSGQPGGVSHQNIGHQVHPGNHQQAYSQLGHPHMGHPQHHLGPVGHQKQGYSQSSMPPQNQHQLYYPFDPNQQPVLNLGQNYLSGGLRSGHGGGPPPSATPPMQGLQSSSPFYGSTGNQSGYPGGSSQGGNLQPLHVAVAPGPQGIQNLRMVCQGQKKKWTPKPHYP